VTGIDGRAIERVKKLDRIRNTKVLL